MKKKTLKQWIAVLLLVVLAVTLISIVAATHAEANDDVLLSSKVYQNRCDIIHQVADKLRFLGFDGGSKLQQEALKQCGYYWHEQNNLKKKALAKEEEERKKAEAEKYANMTLWQSPAQITAYEWTGDPCANGKYPTVGKTVACNSLPLGTRVYIDGVGERVVEDRGASWHSSNWMDLYLGDTASCNAWGVQYRNVYIVR